jgi:EpsI family protein
MIARRDLLLGGACVAAAALTLQLRPHRRVSLLGSAKMESVVPASFPGWSASASAGLVKPKLEGLAASLYNEVVQRTYIGEMVDAEIMLLVAYGGNQSDLLQLHRPEVCYPALGVQSESKVAAKLPLPGGSALPSVRVVAVSGDRRENIVYWTRLGEALPTSGREQRAALLGDAVKGFIPDGVLVRASLVSGDSKAAFAILENFVPALLAAVPRAHRASLIGTACAKSMSAAGV